MSISNSLSKRKQNENAKVGKVPSSPSLSLAYFLALPVGLSLLPFFNLFLCTTQHSPLFVILLRTMQYLLLLFYFKPIYWHYPAPFLALCSTMPSSYYLGFSLAPCFPTLSSFLALPNTLFTHYYYSTLCHPARPN